MGKAQAASRSTTQLMRDQILREMDVCVPYSAGDIADLVGAERRAVYYHLTKLVDQGSIQRRELSTGSVAYWIED